MQPRRLIQPEVTPDQRQPPSRLLARQVVPKEAARRARDDAQVAGAEPVEPPDGGGATPVDEGLTARAVGEREQRAAARIETEAQAGVLEPERVRGPHSLARSRFGPHPLSPSPFGRGGTQAECESRGHGEQATEHDAYR